MPRPRGAAEYFVLSRTNHSHSAASSAPAVVSSVSAAPSVSAATAPAAAPVASSVDNGKKNKPPLKRGKGESTLSHDRDTKGV